MDELSEKDLVVIDHLLDDKCYQSIKDFLFSELANFKPAGIGALQHKTIDQEIRGDLTFWLSRDRDKQLTSFWEVLDELIYVFNRYCFLSLNGFEFHLAKYPPGGHYDKHIDQFHDRSNRVISMVIYLNEEWQNGDGGELEVFVDQASKLIQPIAGRCVLFRSDKIPHAVLQSHKDRFSLTGWLLRKPSALGQFLG